MIEPLPGEPEILRRCARGDHEAFGAIVEHYQRTVFNLVFRMTGNYTDASDVTQEVFIKVFRKIRTFSGRSSFSTWLYTVAVNQSISDMRRRSRTGRTGEVSISTLDGAEGDAPFDPPGREPPPDSTLTNDETRKCIEQALAELSDEYRAIIVLRDVEGLDYAAISRVLRCSRGTVKSRLHRARHELRRKLQRVLVT